MSIRQFHHDFSPAGQGTSAQNPIELTTDEIAQAALLEITQVSLTALPFDLFLDQLLVSNDGWFRWISQLGQIRETKTALSGLFGRFVARAYLTRYFGFSYFEPLKANTQMHIGWPNFAIARKAHYTGDLPDWIVASSVGANTIAVAEAKGSYNKAGPAAQLKSAIKQANGMDIKSGQTTLAIKRFAISTRWAVQNSPNLQFPWLVVDDPADGTREPNQDEAKYLARSVALGHFATLAEGFGLSETAAALEKAKVSEPGHLHLPSEDQVEIVGPERVRAAIAAAVTPAGIVRLPRARDPEDFRTSLISAFGTRVSLFFIDTEFLQEVDRQGAGAAKQPTAVTSPPEVEEDILSKERSFADGSEIIPADRTSLRRKSARTSG